MKIVNLALGNTYNEGWGYQENLLTKYQKLNGNDVTIITSRMVNNKNDDGYHLTDVEEYTNDLGIKVIRLDYPINIWPIRVLRVFKNLYQTIEKEKPDFIFIHNGQFLDSLKVCKYLKNHPNCKASCDNHADETNSAKTFFPKVLHYTIWRYCMNQLNKYVNKFYGVLPIRCDFLKKYYNLPDNKVDLLVMGVDDELIDKANIDSIEFKKQYNINPNQLNIITGGKIDHYKTETLNLMEVVKDNKAIRLFIFGSIGDEIKDKFDELLSDNMTYLGWLSQEQSYAALKACDVAIFPGRHSVIWEQCVGLGVPIVVRKWPGTQHVDIGGNCIFLQSGSKQELKEEINKLLNKEYLNQLTVSANSNNKQEFSYKNIAEKSIQ